MPVDCFGHVSKLACRLLRPCAESFAPLKHPMPYSCNVNIMFFRVTKDFAATDAATIKLYDGVTQMGSTMTIPLSTVQGTGFQTFINYAYTTSGIYSTIKIEPAKTTAGGQGILSIIVERV